MLLPRSCMLQSDSSSGNTMGMVLKKGCLSKMAAAPQAQPEKRERSKMS